MSIILHGRLLDNFYHVFGKDGKNLNVRLLFQTLEYDLDIKSRRWNNKARRVFDIEVETSGKELNS